MLQIVQKMLRRMLPKMLIFSASPILSLLLSMQCGLFQWEIEDEAAQDEGTAGEGWPALYLYPDESVDQDGEYGLIWAPPGEGYRVELQERYSGYDISGESTGGHWEDIAREIPGSETGYRLSSKKGHAIYNYRARLCDRGRPDSCSLSWEDIDSPEHPSFATVFVQLPRPDSMRVLSRSSVIYGGRYELIWGSGGDYHAERDYYISEERPAPEEESLIAATISTFFGSAPTATVGSASTAVATSASATTTAVGLEAQAGDSLPVLAASDGSELRYWLENYAEGDYGYQIYACTEAGCIASRVSATLLTIQNDLPAPYLMPSAGITEIGDRLVAYLSSHTLVWEAYLGSYSGNRRYELRINDGNWEDQGGQTSFEHRERPRGSASSYNVRICATAADAPVAKCSPSSNTVSVETAWLNLPEPFLHGELAASDGSAWLLTWPDLPWAQGYRLREETASTASTPLHFVDLSDTAVGSRPTSHSYLLALQPDQHGATKAYQVEAIPPEGDPIASEPLSLDFFFAEGSQVNPREISDCAGLDAIRSHLSDHYYLAADIDGSCIEAPIGGVKDPFRGSLSGNGHLIYNLSIGTLETLGNSYVALFGAAEGAEIHRLGLKNANIRGGRWVGALIGLARDVTIANVYASVWVSGRKYVGGLVGWLEGVSRISNAYTLGWVIGRSGAKSHIGGIVGILSDEGGTLLLPIENSYSLAWPDGEEYVGALIGEAGIDLLLGGKNYFSSPQGGGDGIGTETSYCSAACQRQEAEWLLDSLREQDALRWDFAIWNHLGSAGKLPCLRIEGSDDCSERAYAYTELVTSMQETLGEDDESIKLEWEVQDEAEEIGSYAIYRDQKPVGVRTKRKFIDNSIEPRSRYLYTILPILSNGLRLADASFHSQQIISDLFRELQKSIHSWEIDLDDSRISAARNLGGSFTQSNPPHWIGAMFKNEGYCSGLGLRGSLIDEICDSGFLGVCERVMDNSGRILESTGVLIKPDNHSPPTRKRVMTHEIGHCLGMVHWNKQAHIMYPYASVAYNPHPHSKERAAAAAVYKAPGDFCRPDNDQPCRSPATLLGHASCPQLEIFERRRPSSTDESWLACYYTPHHEYGSEYPAYHDKFPQFVISEELISGTPQGSIPAAPADDAGLLDPEAEAPGAASGLSSLSESSASSASERLRQGRGVAEMPPKGAPLPLHWSRVTYYLKSDGATEKVRQFFKGGKLTKTIRTER